MVCQSSVIYLFKIIVSLLQGSMVVHFNYCSVIKNQLLDIVLEILNFMVIRHFFFCSDILIFYAEHALETASLSSMQGMCHTTVLSIQLKWPLSIFSIVYQN